MTISMESTLHQPCQVSENNRNAANDSVLKELLIDVLKDKDEYSEDKIYWENDGSVRMSNVSSMALHTFMLEAEKMGKDISMTKKTIIEIS